MRLKFTLLSSLLTATLALSANPLSLPEYEREVKLTFPNEETAKAAAFLLEQEFLTGQVLGLNGGLVI